MSEQEDYFSSSGGDLYFKRNLSHQNRPRELPGMSEEVIRWAKSYSKSGSLAVMGGAGGGEAAHLKNELNNWKVLNIDISKEAIKHGKKKFPDVEHIVASIASKDLVKLTGYQDCIVLSSILCWVDRQELSRVILNIDEIMKSKGILAIFDFFPTTPRKGRFEYQDNIYTFKQNYAQIFKSLGVYQEISSKTMLNGDLGYSLEDQLIGYCILQKS